MLLNDFAQEVFSSLNVRSKTLATYRSMLKCHIIPLLGKMELSEINRSDIKRALFGLPPQTGQMTLAVIKLIFREAMELEMIEKSPVHGIRNPKVIVKARRFLTWDEIEKINFGKYNHHIRFLALHGLRWGEAVALTDDDVRDGKIYVNKSVHGSTKSRAGVRVVPLIGTFKPFPRHPRTLRKAISPYGITIHSLRHTYAYILKKQGIHVTTAQRLLGHSDPKITLSVYTRVLDDELDEAGSVLNLMVQKVNSSDMSEPKSAVFTRGSGVQSA